MSNTDNCECPRRSKDERWDLTWKTLNYKVPVKSKEQGGFRLSFKKKEISWKTVLHELNGEALKGQAVAILGPSGAGKSSLLNVLAGRLSGGIPSGEININGEKRGADWKRVAAYVEQNDIMYPMMTVRESVAFSGLLRLPSGQSKAQKMSCVDEALRVLGLQHVADTRIGDAEHRGISGGEKKRVSIAIELVADPGLIFLDEPTSGLDAFTAHTVCEKITELALKEKRTVLLTIHQPRIQILEMFSKIILMSKGSIVFFGTVSEAMEYFRSQGFESPPMENPADFFLDTITIDRRSEDALKETDERVDRLVENWKSTHYTDQAEAGQAVADQNVPKKPSACSVTERQIQWHSSIPYEIGLIMQRYFRIQFRDIPTLVGTIFQTIAMTLMLAFVFFQLPSDDFASVQSRIGLLFFLPVTLLFTIMIPLINVFTKDREIIMKERNSATYRIFSAYVAKFLSLLPLQFCLTTFFSFGIYYITGLRTDGFQYFLIFYGFMLLVSLASITMGLMVAAAVKTSEMGQLLGPMLVAACLIFGGNLANNDQITWILRWLQYLSPVFYTFIAIIQNELSGQTFGNVPGDFYIDQYSFDQASILWCMGALMILSAAFFVFGFIAICRTTRPKTVLI